MHLYQKKKLQSVKEENKRRDPLTIMLSLLRNSLGRKNSVDSLQFQKSALFFISQTALCNCTELSPGSFRRSVVPRFFSFNGKARKPRCRFKCLQQLDFPVHRCLIIDFEQCENWLFVIRMFRRKCN